MLAQKYRHFLKFFHFHWLDVHCYFYTGTRLWISLYSTAAPKIFAYTKHTTKQVNCTQKRIELFISRWILLLLRICEFMRIYHKFLSFRLEKIKKTKIWISDTFKSLLKPELLFVLTNCYKGIAKHERMHDTDAFFFVSGGIAYAPH